MHTVGGMKLLILVHLFAELAYVCLCLIVFDYVCLCSFVPSCVSVIVILSGYDCGYVFVMIRSLLMFNPDNLTLQQ